MQTDIDIFNTVISEQKVGHLEQAPAVGGFEAVNTAKQGSSIDGGGDRETRSAMNVTEIS
jgi:hypothetical protein